MKHIAKRIASLALLVLAYACATDAAEFSGELARTAKSLVPEAGPKHFDAEMDRLSRAFPIEVDWLNQAVERPQLDKHGRSKALRTYLQSAGNHDFIKSAVMSVVNDLCGSGTTLSDQAAALAAEGVPGTDQRWVALFVKACEARRGKRLATVRAEAPRIVFVKRHTVRASFYGYTEGQSDGYTEKHFLPGSSLCLLDLSSAEPVVTTLLDDPTGVIRDPDVSYDGARVLFAWKKGPTISDDDYHLYEMNMETREIRQITRGKGVAEYEGRYLPSGDLIFASTRCVQAVDCWQTDVSNLYTCDKDGRYLRRLGFDQVHTTYPNVLNDGRVVYTRWDYNDRGQVYPQPLFQMNPDGTGQTEYYGNNSWFPTTTDHARAIPGSSKVVAVLHGHHSWQAGKLALIDRNKGTQEAAGVQLIAPVRETKAVRVDAYGQDEELFRHPCALSEREFIVAMTPDKNSRKNHNTRFGLYSIDADGNRELLHYDPNVSCAHPIALRPRKKPPVRPSMVDYTKDHGVYFVQDVYVGPGLKGVKRGTIEKLRVVAIEYRAAPIGWTNSGGEAGGSANSTPVACGNGSWDPKVILGEATVYEDGSAMFRVPANTPVYFQCIDQLGQVAATMRSWSTLMPGETFGCVGCHENKLETPISNRVTQAMKRGVEELRPFYDVSGKGFSFGKTIQPILNKHCIQCHDGKTEQADGTILPDLTDRVVTGGRALRAWPASYLTLTATQLNGASAGQAGRKALNWISTQSRPSMLPPYHAGSAKSEIVTELRNGHPASPEGFAGTSGDTKLTREELDKFCAWIDLAVPLCGDYVEANTWHDVYFARYIHYQRKRERLATETRRNTEAFYEKQTGKPLTLEDPPPRYHDYEEARKAAK
ncbi:MAG: hypothetical protein HN700_19575 [Verrucomicrobia bacterium]|jgi:hypothetical protein|nr:hypothetical protein [Verrucomicrobiota bacterium]